MWCYENINLARSSSKYASYTTKVLYFIFVLNLIISKLIKKCALMITIDFSSVILDSYLLKKPVISVPVKNNNYGSAKPFMDNSCIISTLDNLES